MMNVDMNYQHIIWSHDQLPYEPFVHEGLLNSFTINPRFTVGLTNYFNITFSQVIGIRKMTWNRDESSAHHRTEDTTTDFNNTLGMQAKGGILGDRKINLKYLYKNAGMKEGLRIYFGGGFIIPSKAVLREDPFKSPDNPTSPEDGWDSGKYDHRHFSLSNGVYKVSAEFQIFNKKFSNPIFYGLVFNVDVPIDSSQYGYLPGINYSMSSSLVFERKSFKEGDLNLLPGGFLYGVSLVGVEESRWHGNTTPNSQSLMLIPTFGGIWPTSKGAVSLSLQKPFFIKGKSIMVGIETNSDDPLNNKTNAFEIVFGYRRNLGYVIPWL